MGMLSVCGGEAAARRMRRAWKLLHLLLLCPFSRALQKRLPGVKVKYLFLGWLGILVGSWALYMHYSSYSELCRGHICQMIICDRYKKGIISGSACKDLCEENTLLFQQCLSSNPVHQVYGGTWRDKEVIIKCGIEEAFRADRNPETVPRRNLVLFDKPTRGTSMDEFKAMLLTFLKSRLGDQQSLGNLVNRIISMADINQDNKVSLAEAKSIWALLQLNEFLLIVSLHEKEHTAQLLGYCGDLYITEKIPYHSLYSIKVPRFLEAVLPSVVLKSLNQWFAPAWSRRAEITIGLLEFVEEIFHGTYGSFYICDTDPESQFVTTMWCDVGGSHCSTPHLTAASVFVFKLSHFVFYFSNKQIATCFLVGFKNKVSCLLINHLIRNCRNRIRPRIRSHTRETGREGKKEGDFCWGWGKLQ
ncbi:divergent protein kinase domain 1B isoform X2 [Heterodontus francisci]|uniref:divergent protein kinase domain 1B isoform X2 n=1 Tax=Heterodontus francisci TaxID=7792 RepID=UPI00355B0A59